jgi:hypothetical protein
LDVHEIAAVALLGHDEIVVEKDTQCDTETPLFPAWINRAYSQK